MLLDGAVGGIWICPEARPYVIESDITIKSRSESCRECSGGYFGFYPSVPWSLMPAGSSFESLHPPEPACVRLYNGLWERHPGKLETCGN